ncbi:MAG TPA: SUMF1/EgtB/PvdO family nonheme iron enzyme, partial [Ktedonobacterales bacterium]|nr:SUMF1/EgtB/PvdO family nonheme iron enzyme [Ktedonobacterales bacterium]
ANTEEGGRGDMSPVGAYPGGASPYGALDMSGNVMEWSGQSPGAPILRPGALAQQPITEKPVLCGGQWDDDAIVARVAHRTRLLAGDRGDDIGFRLIRLP